MKKLLLSLILAVFGLTASAVVTDTVYVSRQSDTYGTVLFRTLHNGSFIINQYDPTKSVNYYMVFDDEGVDSIHIYSTTGSKRKSWDLTKYYFKVLGNTQETVNKLNYTYFTKPGRLPLLSLTTEQRDSLLSWDLAPIGTMILNVTLNSGYGYIQYLDNDGNWQTVTEE